MVKQQIAKVLEKDMDRRAFLRNAGLAILALAGITAALQQVGSFGERPRKNGYGTSAYGGK